MIPDDKIRSVLKEAAEATMSCPASVREFADGIFVSDEVAWLAEQLAQTRAHLYEYQDAFRHVYEAGSGGDGICAGC